MPNGSKVCFVIMPFGETTKNHTETYWTNHFENFLKPLIEENKEFEARRSDELRGNIVDKIIFDLVNSSVVVADLTDKNPNVFWELGIRQSFKHGTITIAEEKTNLPFDIFGKATHFYNNDDAKNDEFRSKFKSALADCLKNPERPDSQVLKTISGRGTLYELINREETIRRLDAIEMEWNWNNVLIERCLDQAIENRMKKLKLKQYTTAPLLRTTAVEFLLTNRYIEADEEFYSLVNLYWIMISSLNTRFQNWSENPKWTEEQILKNTNFHRETNKDFIEVIKNIREKILREY